MLLKERKSDFFQIRSESLLHEVLNAISVSTLFLKTLSILLKEHSGVYVTVGYMSLQNMNVSYQHKKVQI